MNNDSRANHRPFWPLLNELIPPQRLNRMTANYARLTGQYIGVLNARGDWLVPIESSCLRNACPECQQFYASHVRDLTSQMKHICSDCSSQRFGVPVSVRQHLFGILVTEPTKIDYQSLRSMDVSLSHAELNATREDISREVTSELTRRHAERISGLLLGNSSSLQVAEYCDLLVTTVKEIVGCDYAAIFIRDESGADGLPKLAATSGAESESLTAWKDLKRLAVKCLDHGEPIDVKDALDDPTEPRQLALAFAVPFSPLEARSIAALPVAHASSAAPVAVIMAAAKLSHTFDEQDWRTLREVVRLTALNMPRRERTSGGLEEQGSLQLLTSFIDKVTQLQTSDETLDALLGAVVEATDSHVGEIVVMQPHKPDQVKIRAAYGSLHDHTGRISPAHVGVHGQVIRTGIGRVSFNLQEERGFQDLLSNLVSDADRNYRKVLSMFRSGICLPIQSGENTVGVLCLARFDKRIYGERHICLGEYTAARIDRVMEVEKANNLLAARNKSEHDLLELTKLPMETVESCNKTLQSLYAQLITVAMAEPSVKYTSVREYSHRTDQIRYLHINNPENWPKGMPSKSWRQDTSAGRFAARTGQLYGFGTKECALKAAVDGHYVAIFPDVESHLSIPLRVAGLATLIWTLESPRQNLFEGQTRANLEVLARDAEIVLNYVAQMRELLSVSGLERVCAESQTSSKLAKGAADIFQDAFDAKTCAIYLLDPSRKGIECVGVSGPGLHVDPSNERATWYSLESDAPERSLTSYVALKGKTLRNEDLTSKASLLIVPLQGRTGNLGVVRLAGREHSGQPFSDDDEEQAKHFAMRLSFAFEQLFFRLRRQVADRFAGLPTRATVSEAAKDIANAALTVISCSTVETRLLRGRYLRLESTSGDRMEVQPELVTVGAGVCGASANSNPQVLVLSDTVSDQRWAFRQSQKTDTWSSSVRSAVVAELKSTTKSKPLGTISFYSSTTSSFGPADLPVIEEIVRQASLSITNASQHERRFRLLEAIRLASLQAVDEPETISMGASASDIASAFLQLIPEACATVWLLDDAKTHLVCKAVSSESATKGIRGYSAVLRDDLIRTLLDEKKPPRWIQPISDVPELKDMINRLYSPVDRRWIRSIKAAGIAPISLAGGLAGAIFCYVTDDRIDLLTDERTKEIQEDFKKLADHVKLVFGTIQLLERTRTMLELTTPLAVMGALLDAILHYLVQPLHNLRVSIPYVRLMADENVTLDSELSDIGDELDRMDTTIADLKQIVTGRGVGTTKSFDLAELLRKIADRTRRQWPGIKVVCSFSQTSLLFAGIEPVLEAGLRMVVENGAEAIEAKPESDNNRCLTIGLKYDNGEVIVTVTDTGPGMEESVRKASTEPRFTTKPRGSGMGLTVAHVVCDWHGGYLLIESLVDHGTTVSFHLPSDRLET